MGELLTLFAMTWIVAVIPDWMGSWVATLTGATQFASVENQWAEVFFNFVPWHVFPPATQRITDNFWYGLPAGMAVPWDGWIGPLLDWLGVSLCHHLTMSFGCVLVHRTMFSRLLIDFRLWQSPSPIFRCAHFEVRNQLILPRRLGNIRHGRNLPARANQGNLRK